jgi:hypothetical protein
MTSETIAALATLWRVPARCVPGLVRLRDMMMRSAAR